MTKSGNNEKPKIDSGYPEVGHKVSAPIVACLIPCYKQPHPKMQHAFAAMIDFTRKAGVECWAEPIIQSSVVHWTRNCLIAGLLKTKRVFTHILFIDDDIVPEKDYLLRLLAHKVDVIAGLCTRRQDPPIPNARIYNKEYRRFEELWEWPDGLVEVGAVGTGLMLISRVALQQAAEVYFQCLHEKSVYGINTLVTMLEERGQNDCLDFIKSHFTKMSEERVNLFDDEANGWWFRFLCSDNGVSELGEDISFCWQLRKYCKMSVYVDTTIQPEHMGDYGYSIRDFIDHRDPLIADAKRKGNYIAPPSLVTPVRNAIQVIEG